VVDLFDFDGDPRGNITKYSKIQQDEIRDNYLASLGFTVLRFENRFVFQDPEYAKSEIRKVFNKKKEGI
jgi:very-short-patch-repair endonuclease